MVPYTGTELYLETKRTWSLLSDKFISYYCSQFSQSACTRYYRAKRSEKEHTRDYLNRLDGYARSANIKFERSGCEAKEHVKHFLETCGDRDLEDIVSDIQKVEKRDDKRNTSSSGSYGRHDDRSRSQKRRRSEPRHTSRVALVDASVTALITELQTRASSERPDEYSNDYSNDDLLDFYEGDEADQDECGRDCGSRDEIQGEDTYSDQYERLVAAANDNERRNAANGVFARSDNRPQNNGQQSSGFGQGKFRPTTQSGSRFKDNRDRRSFQRPSYGPCPACGGQNHSTHFCFRRCRLCQQVHDFGKCEAFNELDKILQTNVDKKNISLGSRSLSSPQSADLVIDAKCSYAFTGKWEWPEDNNDNVNEKNAEFNGECGVFLDGGKLHGINEDSIPKKVVDDDWLVSICEAGEAAPMHAKTMKLLSGERTGWWSSQRFDRRVINASSLNDVRTSILLDTGANVSIITTKLARRQRLEPIQEHGRQLEVQGIQEGNVSTTTRVKAKGTLGWNTVYEFEIWVEVVLGTDLMIPAGIHLDLFNATAKLPGKKWCRWRNR
ncbi:hypothetical protein PHMEG_00014363 [Phytophthora megakarya]|uniref:Peptidase A2 domain-containing protein n=1 Tax=Phytophthora megakarya TaxID=4795 RepID=A0A225W6J6_9STRA|nr:hypothetical protein PHMEG_00014363 [Phytophthora megakarya]